jgi:hypothetical protein
MGFIFSVIVPFALVIWVGKIAGERNRSGGAWMLLAVLAGLAGTALGVWLQSAGIETGTATENNLLLLSTLAPAAGGLGGVGAIAALVYRRPPLVSSGGARWRVYRIGDAQQAGTDATLVLAPGGLRLDAPDGTSVIIAHDALLQAAGDGEALRLRWRDGDVERTMALLPTEGPDDRAWRVGQSAAMARRLNVPLAKARAVSGFEHRG